MDEPIDELLVEVRASTSGFQSDIAAMRATFDTTLTDGFARAGDVLERGLSNAIRKGSLGFDDLKRIALNTLDAIANEALQMGLDQIFNSGGSGGGNSGGFGGFFSQLFSGLLDLPGRATGGPVAPGRGYLVGERGPELFVPTSAGRVETLGSGADAARNVQVRIQLAAPRGESAPVAMRRSSRQIASAVRSALAQA